MTTLAWQPLTTTSKPAGRDGHGAAVHPGYSTGGGLLIFGGQTNETGSALATSYILDLASLAWSSVTVPGGLSGRYYAAMSYHAASGKVVLFGGTPNGSSTYSDTWTYDPTNGWVQQSPVHSPGGRFFSSLAPDVNGNLILFGGSNGSNLGDTWSWNGTDWTSLSPATSPPATRAHQSTFDSGNSTHYIFSGVTSGYVNTTWAWNGTTWAQISTTTSPDPRVYHGLGYDPNYGQAVVFAGYDGSTGADVHDVWALNPSSPTWTNVSPVSSPGSRELYGSALCYSATLGGLVFFAGYNRTGGSDDDDVWLLAPFVPPNGGALALPNFEEESVELFSVPALVDGGSTALPAGSGAYSSAWSPDGTKLFIGDQGNGKVYVFPYSAGVLGSPTSVTVGSGRINYLAITKDGTTVWALDRGNNKLYPITVATNAVGTGIGGWTYTAYGFVLNDAGTTAYVIDSNFYTAGLVQVVSLPGGSFGTPITCMSKPDPGTIIRVPGTTKIIVNSYQENQYDLIDTATSGGSLIHSWAPGQAGGAGDPGQPSVSPDSTKAFLPVSDGGATSGGIIVSLSSYSTLVTVAGYPNANHGNIWSAWSAADGNIYASTSAQGAGASYAVLVNASTGAVTSVSYGDSTSGAYGGSLQPYQDLTTSTTIYDGRVVISHGVRPSGPANWAQDEWAQTVGWS